MPAIAVLHKRRPVALPRAEVSRLAGNAWEIRIPVDDAIFGITRRTPTPEDWDGAVFFIDDVECEPALGAGVDRGFVRVTALVLS